MSVCGKARYGLYHRSMKSARLEAMYVLAYSQTICQASFRGFETSPIHGHWSDDRIVI